MKRIVLPIAVFGLLLGLPTLAQNAGSSVSMPDGAACTPQELLMTPYEVRSDNDTRFALAESTQAIALSTPFPFTRCFNFGVPCSWSPSDCDEYCGGPSISPGDSFCGCIEGQCQRCFF